MKNYGIIAVLAVLFGLPSSQTYGQNGQFSRRVKPEIWSAYKVETLENKIADNKAENHEILSRWTFLFLESDLESSVWDEVFAVANVKKGRSFGADKEMYSWGASLFTVAVADWMARDKEAKQQTNAKLDQARAQATALERRVAELESQLKQLVEQCKSHHGGETVKK